MDPVLRVGLDTEVWNLTSLSLDTRLDESDERVDESESLDEICPDE